MQSIATMVSHLVETDDRLDAVEYALVVIMVAAIVVLGMAYLGDAIYTMRWEPLANAI
jgi:Flp pilus assembly pilin Flp